MSPHDSRDSATDVPARPTMQLAGTTSDRKADAKVTALSRSFSVSFNEDPSEDSNGCFGRKTRRFKPAIPTSEEELDKVEERCGQNSWQMKAVKFINSGPLQKLLVSLLLCDVIILFIELYLDASYPSCHTVSRDAISCCPAGCSEEKGYVDKYDDHKDEYDDGHRFLGGSGYGYCEYPLEDTHHPAACDDHKYEGVHKAHTILFAMTITILSFFMIEILVLIVCLGPMLFFGRFLYVLDFVVIGSSLSLEIVFATMDDAAAADVAGLLVVFRLWRFVRIGHGLVASTHEMATHKMNKLKKYTRALEEEVIRCGGVLPESKWSLGLLEETASNHLSSGGDSTSVKKISVELGGRVVNTEHLVSKRHTTAGSAEDTERETSSSDVDTKDAFVDNALAA